MHAAWCTALKPACRHQAARGRSAHLPSCRHAPHRDGGSAAGAAAGAAGSCVGHAGSCQTPGGAGGRHTAAPRGGDRCGFGGGSTGATLLTTASTGCPAPSFVSLGMVIAILSLLFVPRQCKCCCSWKGSCLLRLAARPAPPGATGTRRGPTRTPPAQPRSDSRAHGTVMGSPVALGVRLLPGPHNKRHGSGGTSCGGRKQGRHWGAAEQGRAATPGLAMPGAGQPAASHSCAGLCKCVLSHFAMRVDRKARDGRRRPRRGASAGCPEPLRACRPRQSFT